MCTHKTDTVVGSSLQLGILCGVGRAADYIKDDFFVECGAGNTYDNSFGPLCFSAIPAPVDDVPVSDADESDGVLSDQPASSSTTAIMTDSRWAMSAPNQCYVFEEAGAKRRRLRLNKVRSPFNV